MKMKRIVLFFAIFVAVIAVQAQNVGISDQIFTPQSPLHIYRTSDGNVAQFSRSVAANTGIVFSVSGTNWTMRNWQDGELRIQTGNSFMTYYTNGLERMRILANGNVGIGTTTPGALLHVSGQTANIGQGNSLIIPGGFGANIVIGSINQILDGRGMTVLGYQNTSSGVFGNIVGVRNNVTTGTSGGHIFGLDNIVSATDAFAIGSFVSNSITQSIQLGWNSSAGPGAMTIRSTGNVGIGLTDPTTRFHVNGTVRFQGLAAPAGETTALVIDVNGNVKARTLDAVAFNGYTETDPTAWRLTGNANATPPSDAIGSAITGGNFLGTTNGQDVVFATNNLERMRIKSTVGNNIRVGIGTAFATPYPTTATSTLLHIYDGGTLATDYGHLQLGAAKTTAGQKVGEISFHSNVNTSDRRIAGIESFLTDVVAGPNHAGDLRFFTSNNTGTVLERMRITSAGDVGIGTTAPSTKLEVSGLGVQFARITSTNANNVGLDLLRVGAGSYDWRMYVTGGNLRFGWSGDDLATVTDAISVAFTSGNVGIGTTNPTYKLHVIGRFKSDGINETSDARLKKNIEPLQNSLDKILAMQGVTYEWNKEGMEEGVQIGLIAQEVEKILPEIVDTDSEGYKSIQYSVLVAVLIEAMKDQQEEYEDLLQKVQQMEGDLEAIKAMLGVEDDKVSR